MNSQLRKEVINMDNLLLITIDTETGQSIISASADANFNNNVVDTIETLYEVINCLEEIQ